MSEDALGKALFLASEEGEEEESKSPPQTEVHKTLLMRRAAKNLKLALKSEDDEDFSSALSAVLEISRM